MIFHFSNARPNSSENQVNNDVADLLSLEYTDAPNLLYCVIRHVDAVSFVFTVSLLARNTMANCRPVAV